MSAHVSESDKATRYISSLNAARLNGSWTEVPELVRKVDKHAPHRTCLTLAATSEVLTATSSNRRPGTEASHTSLLDQTPKLVHAIESETVLLEDAFQANVALTEIFFLRAEWATVLGRLPHEDVWQQVAPSTTSRSDLNSNTRLAMIKSCYFQGIAIEQTSSTERALSAYNQALAVIDHAPANLAASSEYRLWAARLLGRICTLQSHHSSSTLSSANAALLSYRAWARICESDSSKTASPPSYSLGPYDVSNKHVWSMYYHFLSFVLASDLVYTNSPDSPLAIYTPSQPTENLASMRLQQRSELKRVEAAYESVLLQETKFPHATQSNDQVEQWASSVISNWSILCGPTWRDIDLGEGGKPAVARTTLDILYRAATKTFHSTPILRHLFSVHASLAEFDLAIKAFDSYTDIVSRAKSRAEKTGHNEPGLDGDDIVVLTAAQAIGVLCRYGSETEGEKALDVAKRLSEWLNQRRPNSSATVASRTAETAQQPDKAATQAETTTSTLISAESLVVAHRAIGESQANFARLTHDPAQRSDYREKAIKSLRRAAESCPNGNLDPETALILGTVLAENRQLLPATQIVKFALASSAQTQESGRVATSGHTIPLYHLMSLLLTARGDFENAAEFCSVAFEQFGGSDIMSGQPQGENMVSQMEESEKEALLQLRLTQLALTEMLDGSESAIDAGSQVLALYNKLFGAISNSGPPSRDAAVSSNASFVAPSLKAQDTIKSTSGSILRRNKSTRKGGPEEPAPPLPIANGTQTSTVITNEANEKHHKFHIPHHPLKYLHHNNHTSDPEKNALVQYQVPSVQQADTTDFAQTKQALHSYQADQPLSQTTYQSSHHATASAGPRPRYPPSRQNRHKTTLLIEVWLHIAGQYTRGEFFSEAEAAIDEAHKLSSQLQQSVAKEESSARALNESGWGNGRSVNKLWADVWAEVSFLHFLFSLFSS
jgi:hypothetical protein